MILLPRITTHENTLNGKVQQLVSNIYVSPYDIITISDAVFVSNDTGTAEVEEHNCCIELSNGNSHILACSAEQVMYAIAKYDEPLSDDTDINDEINKLLN